MAHLVFLRFGAVHRHSLTERQRDDIVRKDNFLYFVTLYIFMDFSAQSYFLVPQSTQAEMGTFPPNINDRPIPGIRSV